MSYSEFPRGSEWRKWDLHVHTPFSFQQAFPNWDEYIKNLKLKAIEHDIEVIGVTDYFCTDGYEKLLEECEDENKATEPHIKLANGKKLYLIPIVELRLDNFTSDGTSVNIHVAFSPQILPATIKNSFLENLEISYQGKTLKCKESDLIKIGHAEQNSGTFNANLDISSMEKGIRSKLSNKALAVITFSVSMFEKKLDSFDDLLETSGIKKESYLIIIANKGHGGLSDFKWTDSYKNISRSGIIRQNLLHLTDICFSNSPDDRKFLLGEATGTDKKEVIERFRTFKPCIWGCDAHETRTLFHPSNGATNDYTWIKADPTFEGLKQTLYEPNDRVRIQPLKPDVKNERHIISELKFNDTGLLFGQQTILMNENLNAIIGGKSSGKSLLLYATAKSIDPEQVENTATRLRFDGYKFDDTFNFEVVWKNGDVDNYRDVNAINKTHKITYIPQLYINYLVEKDNKQDLNSLIKSILGQDESYKLFAEGNRDAIGQIAFKIDTSLRNYLQIRIKLNDIIEKQKETGYSDSIGKSIMDIERQITEGRKSSNLSADEFEKYNKLLMERNQITKEGYEIYEKEAILNKILGAASNSKSELLGEIAENGMFYIKGEVEKILDEMTTVPEDIKNVVESIKADFEKLVSNISAKIQANNFDLLKRSNVAKFNDNNILIQPYLLKLQGQESLKKLTDSLEIEKERQIKAINFEKQFEVLKADYDAVRKQTADLLKERFGFYKKMEEFVNNEKNIIAEGITLSARLVFKQINFTLFEQVNKVAIQSKDYFNELIQNGEIRYDLIPELYGELLKVNEGNLSVGNSRIIPLRQNVSLEDVLRGLIKDEFEIDYTVRYKGDELLSMSPGKKGTVLLILFLQISSSEYPILIDQPEDNLDNRTIYDLLCHIIKLKKKERQIIIVSHNANLVVATDTENIIVANQEGQEKPLEKGQHRFGYVNGSIEFSYERQTSINEILKQQGIREHVCDILEGGDHAFKQRELKYAIK